MPESLALSRALNEMKFETFKDYYTNHQGNDLLSKRATKDNVLAKVVETRLPEARQQIVDSQYRSFSSVYL